MPPARLEPTDSVFEKAKTVLALDRAATVRKLRAYIFCPILKTALLKFQ
jgi:hypothetical protein